MADNNGKHPPTRFDVRQKCQQLYDDERERKIRARRLRDQFAERDECGLLPPPTQTIEEVRDEMRSRGLNMAGRTGADRPHSETPETVRAKLGLTPEEWATLPDATNRGGTNWKKAKP